MKQWRNYLLLMLTAVMVLSIPACSKKDTGKEPQSATPTETPAETQTEESDAAGVTADETLKATIIWRRFDDSFQSGFRIIMQDIADTMGNVTLDMQDGEDDPVKVINKLDVALAKGIASIAICAPDRASTAEMMEKCKAENIPVVFFNMEPLEETMQAYDKIYYVGANAKESGVMCAQALCDYWLENTTRADKNGDGKLQLVILQGEIGQQDVVLRTDAYYETLETNGIEYEVVKIDTANWDKAQALDKVIAYITELGLEGIEGILCNNDGMATGAVQAVLNNGWNTGNEEEFIPVVGIDATVEALQMMKDGSLWGTVLNDRSSQSTAVLNVLKAVKTETEISEDIVGVECTVDGKYIWVPYEIVNKDNLEATLELMLDLE